ncbi:hypothetical protein [Agromyces mariniharenae]|uniref:Uncharacterized protein n=1 Tax=Agromyces mariniharenae TaxID=2604423 RepID=A0A5S4V841_9MICO|nr:hypothetical protein [Agromyces mariniharenae]TYL50275.1 hypothetical protein FYC51_13710 [Agromyces mariniharenae]
MPAEPITIHRRIPRSSDAVARTASPLTLTISPLDGTVTISRAPGRVRDGIRASGPVCVRVTIRNVTAHA